MNPYATKLSPARNANVAASHQQARALFAAEVYAEDEETDANEALQSKDNSAATLDEISRLRNELRGEARALRTQIARPTRVPAELLAELATLRASVDELLASKKSSSSIPGGEASGSWSNDESLASVLRRRGIEGGAAWAMTRIVSEACEVELEDESIATDALREASTAIVRTTPWPARTMSKQGAKMLIALVGPAGVGKTTTAAKLAARAKMAKKSVALISCDTFRVGAMDQLEKYADLLEAKFHCASTQDELLEIIADEDADVIIVDTSGRPVESDATEALLGAPDVRAAASTHRKVEVLLCVPAAIRANDAARVHRDFAAAAPTALVITKIDETDTPAGIAHAAFATKLPISTLCNGQRVPEDILSASNEAVGALLFPNNSKDDASR